MIPSSSQNNETRRQGEEFPVNLLQLRGSPSNNLGAPVVKGTKGQARAHKNAAREEWSDGSNPEKRAENDKNIGLNKSTRLSGNGNQVC